MTHRTRSLLVAVIAAGLLLAGCADGGQAGAPPSTTQDASTAQSSPPNSSAAATIKGAPQSLTDAVAERYAGSEVAGTAHLGRWRGDRIAVVVAGEDVTLAVQRKGSPWEVVGGWWPSLGEHGAVDLGGTRHVLLIGSDARPGEPVDRSRADALQLVGVDGQGGSGVMGFARDVWAPIPGHGHGKLNSAMVYAGPKGQVGALRSLTGITPRGYVLIDFEGFAEVIDDMGGLRFVAPFAMRSQMHGGQMRKGALRLSGKDALIWARERKTLPGGDFDRSRNQGLLLAAAGVQARLDGPAHLPKALTAIDKHAKSNLTAEQMLTFAACFYRVELSKSGRVVAKGGFGTSPDGQSIVVLDQASKTAFQDFKDGRLGS